MRKGLLLFFFILSINHAAWAESLLTFGVDPHKALDAKFPVQTSSTLRSHAVLVSHHEATLSSEFTGRVTKVGVRSGQHFKKDQLLIAFQCEEHQANYQKALAEMMSTKEAHASAKELDKLKSISKLEVVKAKSAFMQAQAETARTAAVMRKCRIQAPYDGQVVEVIAHEHEVVEPGAPLIRIVNNHELFVHLFVPSHWLKWIQKNTIFKIKLRELDKPLRAHITQIGGKVDTHSQTVQLYGKIDSHRSALVSGMSGEAYFERQPAMRKQRK